MNASKVATGSNRALVIAALFALPWVVPASGAFTKVKVGDVFPGFKGQDNRGAVIALEDYHEAPLVLAFVRPDQELSLRVLRDLQGIYSELKTAGAEVVVIASDREGQLWPEIVKENGITLRLLNDEDEAVAVTTGLIAYPTTALLSRGSILTSSFLLHDFDFRKVILDEVLSLQDQRGGQLPAEEIERRRREERLTEAKREEEAGNYPRALQLYAELSEVDPDPFRIHVAHGELLLRIGQAEAALPPLQRARAIHARSARVISGLGLAYARIGQEAEAMPLLEEAVEIDPNPGPAHRELSRIYMEAGDLDKALLHAKKALAAAERAKP